MTETTEAKTPYEQVRDWLIEHNAHLLWGDSVALGIYIRAYALKGRVLLVQEYTDGRGKGGVEVYAPLSDSNRLDDLFKALEAEPPIEAPENLIINARHRHAGNDLNIDDGAAMSVADDGSGAWVQAWVWMPIPSEEV